MNLHAIVGPIVAVVNSTVSVSVQVSTGYTTDASGKRTAIYATAVTVPAQIQALTYSDIRQIEGLNLQGTRRGIYLYGEVDGLVRATNQGGDLITDAAGNVWLVALVLEQWSDAGQPAWCKVAVTLQDGS